MGCVCWPLISDKNISKRTTRAEVFTVSDPGRFAYDYRSHRCDDGSNTVHGPGEMTHQRGVKECCWEWSEALCYLTASRRLRVYESRLRQGSVRRLTGRSLGKE